MSSTSGPESPRRSTVSMFRPGRWVRDFVDDIANSSPARLALVAFTAVVLVFVGLLLLPISKAGQGAAEFSIAVFVAVSSVCVTGLTPVVTEDYWSDFGIGVITAGMQVGGLGILTLASVMGMAVSKRLGVRQRLIAAQATNTVNIGAVGTLLRVVIITVLTAEAVVAALLFPRFLMRGDSVLDSLWYSVFYSVSAFNNAGFTIHPGGMQYFADDYWILTVIGLAVFVGSLGFPVVLMISVAWHSPKSWDLHTKLTLVTSGILVAVGALLLGFFEWNNPKTLGPQGPGQSISESVFMAIMTRSGGFSTMDVGAMDQSSHLVLDVLMFIGGGSSSTAGGIKVTTLAVLVLAAWSEGRGYPDTDVFGRRLAPATIRLALAVTLVGAGIIIVGTLVLLSTTRMSLDLVLFEVISAFGTCGLTSGVSAAVGDQGRYVLSLLMFVGRLGTITLAAALSMQEQQRLYRLPEERPIVG